MKIRGVSIGDKFKNGTYKTAVVVDFYEVKSMLTGEVIRHECIAKGIDTLAKNEFHVPFNTVIRNKIE